MGGEFQSKVAIVILNYNTSDLLAKYLPLVETTTYVNKDIWVVDNASTDDSVELLKKNFSHLNILVSPENTGYAGGYNWALNQIEADYYVLLNSDVEVKSDWIEPLVEMAQRDESISAIQPKILDLKDKSKFEYAGACGGYLDKWGYAFCRGRIFDHLEEDKGQYNTEEEVFWATGACMFIRAEDYHAAGGLDNDFFAHMEEIDLCWRLHRQGKKVMVQPKSVVYHLGGGTLSEGSKRKYFLNFRNNLILLVKNSHSSWFFLVIWRMILDGVSAVKFLVSGKPQLVGTILKAHFAFWGSLSASLAKRKAVKAMGSHRAPLYKRSIVWQHFAKKKNTFSELP